MMKYIFQQKIQASDLYPQKSYEGETESFLCLRTQMCDAEEATKEAVEPDKKFIQNPR